MVLYHYKIITTATAIEKLCLQQIITKLTVSVLLLNFEDQL